MLTSDAGALQLVSATDNTVGLYQTIWFTGYNILNTSIMASVTEYATDFNIRIVYMYNYPYPNLGVTPTPSLVGTNGDDTAFSYDSIAHVHLEFTDIC